VKNCTKIVVFNQIKWQDGLWRCIAKWNCRK